MATTRANHYAEETGKPVAVSFACPRWTTRAAAATIATAINHAGSSQSGYVTFRAASSDQAPKPVRARVRAAAMMTDTQDQPLFAFQNPLGEWNPIAATARSAARMPGPIGPPNPRIVSVPPPTSAIATIHTQNFPGANPIPSSHPAVPAMP